MYMCSNQKPIHHFNASQRFSTINEFQINLTAPDRNQLRVLINPTNPSPGDNISDHLVSTGLIVFKSLYDSAAQTTAALEI